MPGPPPAYDRARRNVPVSGDWKLIPAESGLEVPKMPSRPRRPLEPKASSWSARTKRSWAAWWKDGAASVWTGADRDSIEQAANLLEDYVRTGDTRTEVALLRRLDSLGLTPKGKRDLRLLVTEVAPGSSAGQAEADPVEDDEVARRRRERDEALGRA